jgi:hypothetical protein
MPARRLLKHLKAVLTKLHAGRRFQDMNFNRSATRKANTEFSAVDSIKCVPQLHKLLVALEIEVITHRSFLIHLDFVMVSENSPDFLLKITSKICQP